MSFIIELGGLRTLVHEFGDPQGLPVLALHSAGLDGSAFRYIGETLATEGVRLIAPDLRGHGHSIAAAADISLDLMANDVIELASQLSFPAVSLLGTSMGGVVAGLAVDKEPGAWRDVSIVCSPDQGYPSFHERANLALAGGMIAVVEAAIERWFSRDAIEIGRDYVEWSRHTLLAMDPECWAATWQSFAGFAGFPAVRSRVPVHCFSGAADVSTPPELMDKVRRATGSKSPLTVIADGTHQLVMERADDLASAWLAAHR